MPEEAPLRPINPYGHSKAVVEQVLQELAAAGGITYISLRYFNVAGVDRDGRNGEGKEGGTCIRDYIHVEDLAAAHLLALEAHHGGADAAGYGCRARRLGKIGQVLKYSFIAFIKRSRYGDGTVMFALTG